MPEFESNPWGAEEYHQAALKHYGIKQNALPADNEPLRGRSAHRPSMQLTEGTGMPVPKATRKALPQENKIPYPVYRSPVPVPSASGTTAGVPSRKPVANNSPAPVPQPPRTQSPGGSIQKIYRTQDGKFDPSTIANANQRTVPPYTRPVSPAPLPSRPSSRTSNRPEVKRTNSNASTDSWRARRDSLTRFGRRLSDAFKDTFDIVKMDKHERRDFVRTKYNDAERRTDSESRSASRTDSAAQVSTSSLGQSERSSKPSSEGSKSSQLPGKPMPGNLTKSEKLAINVSKAVDPLKVRGRSGTQDSDMSFGMTDLAPDSATMLACSECSRPTYEYLINGLCKECHALEVKIAKAKPKGKSKFVEACT